MTDRLTIRPAIAGDAPAIRDLLAQLQGHEGALQPDRKAAIDVAIPRILADVEASIANGTGATLIALLDGRPVGLAMVHDRGTTDPSLPPTRRTAYVSDLVVDHAARGAGVGSRLLDAAAAWGAARGLKILRLGAITENEGAIRLYERVGFRNVERTFERPIG